MLRKWLRIYSKILDYHRGSHSKSQLDILFSSKASDFTAEESALWLVKLSIWLRDGEPNADQWAVRSRFLFQVLRRTPEWQAQFELHIRHVFSQIHILDLLCESGLPLEQGLWSELWDRIFVQILPRKPLLMDSSLLLAEFFPEGTHLDAIERVDILPWMQALSDSMRHLQPDLEDAFVFLISQARAIALHPSLRRRMKVVRLRELPYYSLTYEGEQFLKSKNAEPLLLSLEGCHRSLDNIYLHLQEFGVSTDLVFRLEKVKLFLLRISLLIPVLQNPTEASVKALWIHLIDLNQRKRGIRSLYQQSSRLLSQKIVEKNSETGDHYIARTKKESLNLFKDAAGGGLLTSVTVFAKVGILSLTLSPFMVGFLASMNYAISFLVIQMFGWTLATKQPANTATTIASKLNDLQKPERLKALVDEIFFLFRSQTLAILGNVLFVVPTVLALTFLHFAITGNHILNHDQAVHNYEGILPTFSTFTFAAWTGVLLWLSSVIAGWVDNWFAYREIPMRILQNTALRRALSPKAAETAAKWVKRHIAAVASNISLGFLLGLSPEILKFIGVPLEVRHVTLSTGALAASLPVLGWQAIHAWHLLWVVLGVLGVGICNVAVSFSLAFAVALRAKNVSKTQKHRIYQALLKKIRPKLKPDRLDHSI